jgi:hypothetical protein
MTNVCAMLYASMAPSSHAPILACEDDTMQLWQDGPMLE